MAKLTARQKRHQNKTCDAAHPGRPHWHPDDGPALRPTGQNKANWNRSG